MRILAFLALLLPLAAQAQPIPGTYNPVTATGGTTPRTLAARAADVVNVKDYGAIGDATTDNTTAFALAAAAIPSTGGILYIPAGQYLVKATTSLKSGTTVRGDGWGSVVLADSTWPVGGPYSFFRNANWAASVITDSDITVEDLQLDYGTFGPVSVPGGGKHQISFRMARDMIVRHVLFQVRTAEDAIAGLGDYNFLVEGNSAYDFSNCAYDFWTSPQKTRVIGNYAETASSGQMVNYNPENTTGSSTGNVATGLVLADNHFVTTGASATPMQLEPLGTGTTANDITVTGNIFDNTILFMRGAISGATVTGNIFNAPTGGNSVIASYAQNGGTPQEITVSNNVINNPDTTVGAVAVIRIDATASLSTIIGNRINGASYGTVPAISTAAAPASVIGNYASNGIMNVGSSLSNNTNITIPNTFGYRWLDATSGAVSWFLQSDNNMIFQGTNASGGTRNIFTLQQHSASSSIAFLIPVQMNSALNPIGGVGPAGNFTQSPRNIGTCAGAPNVAYTAQTPVATEFYVSEVFVPANVTLIGVAVFNSATISGNMKVGLANSSGVNVATSASTAMAGTSADQRVPFTGTYAAVGPATYYVTVFYDNATVRPNTITAGSCGVQKATGQVFATGFTSFTPAGTFTTALGPVATLY